MRLGNKKRICFHISKESKRKCSAFLWLIFILALCAATFLCFLKTVRPVMVELAKSKAAYIANQIIDKSVSEIFKKQPIKYSDIIRLEKDQNGNIRAVQSDLFEVNSLKTEIALDIQRKIAEASETDFKIPSGSLTGIDFLSGAGPYIKFNLMPYGNAQVDFISSFETAGVNQTRLMVNLNVKTNFALLMPTVNTGCTVENTVPLFQTIVVGEVPESFFNVDRADDALVDDALDMAQ